MMENEMEKQLNSGYHNKKLKEKLDFKKVFEGKVGEFVPAEEKKIKEWEKEVKE